VPTDILQLVLNLTEKAFALIVKQAADVERLDVHCAGLS